MPGLTGDGSFVKSMREGCGKLLCTRRCMGTADIYWPQVVGSGVLYVVMHGNPEKQCLVKVLEPLLRKLSPSSWDVSQAHVIWNAKKPVWFQVRVKKKMVILLKVIILRKDILDLKFQRKTFEAKLGLNTKDQKGQL